MSYLSSLITLPNTMLREPSQTVSLSEYDVKQLALKMISAVLEWEESRPNEIGVALSAIQIAEPYRVVVIRQDFGNKNDKSFLTLVNPKISRQSKKIDIDYEGCLSITDVYGLVPRAEKILVQALNTDGEKIEIKARGFLSRVLQHEIDHTNGIMFIDHIKDQDAFYRLDRDGALKKVNHQEILNSKELWVNS